MCTVTVELSLQEESCHTCSISCEREKTDPRVARHEPEQVELARGQRDLATVREHRALAGIDPQAVELQRLLVGRLARAAAQHGLHSGDELAGRERLDDIVIRAAPQAGDPV